MDEFLPPEPGSVFYKKEFEKQIPKLEPKTSTKPVQQSAVPSSVSNNYPSYFNPINTHQPPNFPTSKKEPTPNVISSLCFGIFSLLFTISWLKWYGTAIGIILAGITIYLSNSGLQMINTSPHVFCQSGRASLTAAKILAVISFALCGISFIALIIYFSTVNNDPYLRN